MKCVTLETRLVTKRSWGHSRYIILLGERGRGRKRERNLWFWTYDEPKVAIPAHCFLVAFLLQAQWPLFKGTTFQKLQDSLQGCSKSFILHLLPSGKHPSLMFKPTVELMMRHQHLMSSRKCSLGFHLDAATRQAPHPNHLVWYGYKFTGPKHLDEIGSFKIHDCVSYCSTTHTKVLFQKSC